MPGIIVTGHGHFATGIVSAAELILGPQDGLVAVDFPEGDTATQITENLTGAVDSFGGAAVVVLADLRGGQPFNVASAMCADHPNLRVVFGTNLPVLIEALTRFGGNAMQVPEGTLLDEVARAGAESVGRFPIPGEVGRGPAPRESAGEASSGEPDDWD